MSKSILLVTLLIFLGKLLAFVKDVLISSLFGASGVTDAYFIGSAVPTILFSALFGSIAVVVLPRYIELKERFGRQQADSFIDGAYSLYILLSVVLTLLGFLFAPQLVSIFAPTFAGDIRVLTISLSRVFVATFAISCTIGFLTTIQYAQDKIYTPNLVSIVSNATVILITYIFSSLYGIHAVAYGAFLGWIVQVPLHYRAVSREYWPKFNLLELKIHGTALAPLLFIPFLTISVDQLNVLIDSSLGSRLEEGSVSSLNYAQKLVTASVGTFSLALTLVIFPRISKYFVRGANEKFRAEVFFSYKIIALFVFPLIVIFCYFSEEIVTFVYGRGKFDTDDIALTSKLFFIYSFGSVFVCIKDLNSKIFYAKQNIIAPLKVAVIVVVSNLGLSVILVRLLDAEGLAYATVVSHIIGFLVQARMLSRFKI